MSETNRSKAEDALLDREVDPRRSISLRIGILARLMRNIFDREIASLGVTRSQWTMIAAVASRPGANQRVIAELLEMSEASAGRLIDRLCNEGLLERRAREDDKRARAVFVTDRVGPIMEKLTRVAEANEERLFRDFDEDELETLVEYLDRLYARVSRG